MSKAELVLETIACGKRSTKSEVKKARMPRVVATKAWPERTPARTAAETRARAARTASTAEAASTPPRQERTVQARKAIPIAAATGVARAAIARARSATAP